jgi:hypothetical protein
VCWDASLEAERRRAIKAAGFEVDPAVVAPAKLITHIRLTQPDAVVIDLSKLPHMGEPSPWCCGRRSRLVRFPRFLWAAILTESRGCGVIFPDVIFGSWAFGAREKLPYFARQE